MLLEAVQETSGSNLSSFQSHREQINSPYAAHYTVHFSASVAAFIFFVQQTCVGNVSTGFNYFDLININHNEQVDLTIY